MFRQSMFLVLGLMAAFALGCEKKEEAPATPDTDTAATQAEDMKKDVEGAAKEAEKDLDAAAADVKEKVGEAADKVGEAADEVKDKVEDIKVPG